MLFNFPALFFHQMNTCKKTLFLFLHFTLLKLSQERFSWHQTDWVESKWSGNIENLTDTIGKRGNKIRKYLRGYEFSKRTLVFKVLGKQLSQMQLPWLDSTFSSTSGTWKQLHRQPIMLLQFFTLTRPLLLLN